jgi:hypothetical protein
VTISGFGLSISDGESYAFAGIIHTDDDELAGSLFFGDLRRHDLKELDISR